MFGLADKYKLNQKIDVKTFIKKDFKTTDKKRLKESLKSVVLTHQLMGEEIPSIINSEYNCQVILFLDIEIDNIKNASYVAGIIQNELKTFCVINIHDKNVQRYFFAEKRLNLQDSNNVVIENTVSTKESSLFFYENWKEKLEEFLKFNNIISRENKVTFYREMMTKAFIISELNLVPEGNKLLESTIWYNSTNVKKLLGYLKEINGLRLLSKNNKNTKEKICINKKIKSINEELVKLLGCI